MIGTVLRREIASVTMQVRYDMFTDMERLTVPNELAEFCNDDVLAQRFFKASQSRKNTCRRTSIAALQRTLTDHDVIADKASVLALMAQLEGLGAGKIETGNPESADGFEWAPDLLSVAARAGFINQWTEAQPTILSGETCNAPQEASSEAPPTIERIALPNGAHIELAVRGDLKVEDRADVLIRVQNWLDQYLLDNSPATEPTEAVSDADDLDDVTSDAMVTDADETVSVEDDIESLGAASAPSDFEHLMALALHSAGSHKAAYERVLARRYGVQGQGRATLEEVAEELGLARERIRQIQVLALRRLRWQFAADARRLLDMWAPKFWEAPAVAPGVITRDVLAELCRDGQTLPGAALFALALAYGESGDTSSQLLTSWLDDKSQRLTTGTVSGWVSAHTDTRDLARAYAVLDESDNMQRLPAPLRSVAALVGLDEKVLSIAAVLHPAKSVFAGYLLPATYATNMRRAVRAHVLLHHLYPQRFIPMLDLWKEYRARFSSDDACSPNDIRLAVDDRTLGAPHLFAATGNKRILALGETDGRHGLDLQRKGPRPVADIDGNGVPAQVFAAMAEHGPMTRSQIAAKTGLRDGQFQPLLDQRLEFERVGQNIHWLTDWREKLADWRLSALSIDNDEAEYFAAARIAGEAVNLMPLWSLGFEQHVCERAMELQWESCAGVLAVAQPGRWSVADDLRDSWEQTRMRLGKPWAPNNWRIPGRVPDSLAGRLLIAALYVRDHGGLSWISFNATVQPGRPMASSSALALILLGRVGVLLAPTDNRWYQWHAEGPRLNEVISALEFEYFSTGSLDCNRGAARQLLKVALENREGDAWFGAPQCTEELQRLWDLTEPKKAQAKVATIPHAADDAASAIERGESVAASPDRESTPNMANAGTNVEHVAEEIPEVDAPAPALLGDGQAAEPGAAAPSVVEVVGPDVTPAHDARASPIDQSVTELLESSATIASAELVDAPTIAARQDQGLELDIPTQAESRDATIPEPATKPLGPAQAKSVASLVDVPTSELVQRANAGDLAAQCQLGVTFLDWSKQGPMSKSAMYWLERAGGAGHARAQRILGVLHLRGKTDLTDRQIAIRKGIEWLALAMRAGDVEATYWVGLLYLKGEYLPSKPEKGRQLLIRAALNGHPDAGYRLARNIAGTDPVVVQRNPTALRWMSHAAKRGSSAAQAVINAICALNSLP